MSATQATVTSTQVAVRYRQNVGSLSIDMSANCRTTTLGQNIDWHINRDIGRYLDRHFTDMSVDLLTDTSRLYIGRVSVNMSTDISVEHRSICRPTLDQYVGRHVDRYIGRGVHKIHMIQIPKKTKNLLQITSSSHVDKFPLFLCQLAPNSTNANGELLTSLPKFNHVCCAMIRDQFKMDTRFK